MDEIISNYKLSNIRFFFRMFFIFSTFISMVESSNTTEKDLIESYNNSWWITKFFFRSCLDSASLKSFDSLLSPGSSSKNQNNERDSEVITGEVFLEPAHDTNTNKRIIRDVSGAEEFNVAINPVTIENNSFFTLGKVNEIKTAPEINNFDAPGENLNNALSLENTNQLNKPDDTKTSNEVNSEVAAVTNDQKTTELKFVVETKPVTNNTISLSQNKNKKSRPKSRKNKR